MLVGTPTFALFVREAAIGENKHDVARAVPMLYGAVSVRVGGGGLLIVYLPMPTTAATEAALSR